VSEGDARDEARDEEDADAGGSGGERDQARGGSGEPPVPDSGTAAGDAGDAGDAGAAGDQVTDEQSGPGAAEGASHAGVADSAAVQVPEAHEADVPDDLRDEIEEIMSRYPQIRSASIPVLFAIQRRYGWCSPEGIRQGAAVMGVTAAYLESVASFYDLFHLEPAGEHRVLVCTNISCWMRGGDELLDVFCGATGVDVDAAAHGGAVSDDGEVFVQGFECLGACDLAPMASIDERYYGPLERNDAVAAIAALRSGDEVLPGRAMADRPAAGGPDPDPDPRVANAG
jgi:NADH-quinone oxidoreductase subunit E